jgi:hypothetical protein
MMSRRTKHPLIFEQITQLYAIACNPFRAVFRSYGRISHGVAPRMPHYETSETGDRESIEAAHENAASR